MARHSPAFAGPRYAERGKVTCETEGTPLMTALMLTGGVLRVIEPITLPDGTRVDCTRDITPGAPDYGDWLPFAVPEEAAWRGDTDDAAILDRWRAAASA
ncbi:hypothetical protein B0I32_104494 [Nonomuraea fuscirosea]|jgi:hypothetical protein|uniref:Uncharacterized protein n=2 Tax=Nonomuraea fuscirosea TaxID=1291556 RepID=A0A2T0N5Y5_9ACTN|nr:hypothetical protein B0I32_104494 [Nonomuraea fuscirosea]